MSRVLAFIVYQASSRDPMVSAVVVPRDGFAGITGYLDSSATRPFRPILRYLLREE